MKPYDRPSDAAFIARLRAVQAREAFTAPEQAMAEVAVRAVLAEISAHVPNLERAEWYDDMADEIGEHIHALAERIVDARED